MILRVTIGVVLIVLLLALIGGVAEALSKRKPGGSRHRALPRKIHIQKNPQHRKKA